MDGLVMASWDLLIDGVEINHVGHHGGELLELVQGGLHPLAFYRGPRHGETRTAEAVAGAW